MFLTDILFPKTCLGCGYLGVYICPRCQSKLIYLKKDKCLYCGEPSFFGLTHYICKKNSNIDGHLSLLFYNDFLKKIIKQLKYRLSSEIWQDFYKILQPKHLEKLSFYKQMKKDFYIQPIPLHSKKLKERGFNQANLIAEFLANFLNFPVINYLLRKKPTLSQAQTKSKRDRYLNLRSAFFLKNQKQALRKNIILVDDVVTTGWTVKEAARTLKLDGANEVFVFSLASG